MKLLVAFSILSCFGLVRLSGADLPAEVEIRQEVSFSVVVPDSSPFPCTLNPGLRVQLNALEGTEADITYIGRVKLSGVDREMFEEAIAEPSDAGPGRAVLADQAAMQLAGPDGERAGTVGLPKGGVVEVLAVRGDKVDIQLPLLRGRVPMASTDAAARVEALRKAEAERVAEIEKEAAEKRAMESVGENAEGPAGPAK